MQPISEKTTDEKSLTPMMQQYMTFKSELDERTLLFFRLGDFFELFFEDAEIGSRLLGITLTKRQDTPMAGIPAHTLDNYAQKCLTSGYKVAICDQVEPATTGKLVKRSIVKILTPGTTLEAHTLEDKHIQYLVALNFDEKTKQFVCSWADLASGQITLSAHENHNELITTLHNLSIGEILIPEGASLTWQTHYPDFFNAISPVLKQHVLTEIPLSRFYNHEGSKLTRETLQLITLEGFGISDTHPALGTTGALIHYATQNLCQSPKHLKKLTEYFPHHTLRLDPATSKGLEIKLSSKNTLQGSLLHAIDRTQTAYGSRLLKDFLAYPLLDIEAIKKRQTFVSLFKSTPYLTKNLQDTLRHIRDIPRLLTRLTHQRRNPRELGALRSTLSTFPILINLLKQFKSSTLTPLIETLTGFEGLTHTLCQSLNETLPNSLGESPVINSGICQKLDELRALNEHYEQWLTQFETEEQQKTGIKNLKVRYHGSLGYCIEITKANLSLVPAHYIRRQTGVNSERFTTDNLREQEKAVSNSKETAFIQEQVLFEELVQKTLKVSHALYLAAESLAMIDIFSGWGLLAHEWHYTCPIIDNSTTLLIEEGRHPVIEQTFQLPENIPAHHNFIPNDISIGQPECTLLLITGPNMAGKSTYIRQTALIVIMAQLGMWVPAKKAHIGICDHIFARIGAHDDLSHGHSTFMVEMTETAHLLHHSTSKSLILLDEVGRGTSTYDGLSIAWALVEHLSHSKTRTLFATHYHELTVLEKNLENIQNACMLIDDSDGQLTFLRKVVPGAATRSYGIQVAKLAGLPHPIIERAHTILKHLENKNN